MVLVFDQSDIMFSMVDSIQVVISNQQFSHLFFLWEKVYWTFYSFYFTFISLFVKFQLKLVLQHILGWSVEACIENKNL